jgi:hypothetical protein
LGAWGRAVSIGAFELKSGLSQFVEELVELVIREAKGALEVLTVREPERPGGRLE